MKAKLGSNMHVQADIRNCVVTITTAWEAFLHLLEMPKIPSKTPIELAAENPHHITDRIQVYMCDESQASAEQRERAASAHPDVLIVDLREDWNGLPIEHHKQQFCVRAEQNENPESAGRVKTRFLHCSLLLGEVGEWGTQDDSFVLSFSRAAGEALEQDLPALLIKIRATSISAKDMKCLLKKKFVVSGLESSKTRLIWLF